MFLQYFGVHVTPPPLKGRHKFSHFKVVFASAFTHVFLLVHTKTFFFVETFDADVPRRGQPGVFREVIITPLQVAIPLYDTLSELFHGHGHVALLVADPLRSPDPSTICVFETFRFYNSAAERLVFLQGHKMMERLCPDRIAGKFIFPWSELPGNTLIVQKLLYGCCRLLSTRYFLSSHMIVSKPGHTGQRAQR